jgi:undecaprenyl-diphosphatase
MYLFDATITQWINNWAGESRLIDFAMIWVSSIGVPVLIVAVACQWWRRYERQHIRHILVSAGFSFMLGLGLNQFILLFVHRVRPYDAGITRLLIPPSGDPSFPSDHATAAFAIAVALLSYRSRGAAMFLFAAGLISVSRIYIGTHYVSDIVGGAVTGILAVGLIRRAYQEGSRADLFLTSIL